MILRRNQSLLLVVDMQERLMGAMDGAEEAAANAAILIQAANRLEIPVIVSEQYPKGLGPTIEAVARHLPAGGAYAKTHFSCVEDPVLAGAIARQGRPQVVICGIEAHVCVLQTAIGLKERDLSPYVAVDATTSRRAATKAAGLARMRDNGVELGPAESVLFEWMGRAGTPEFKDVSKLIR